MAACKDPGRGEDGPVGGFAEKAPAAGSPARDDKVQTAETQNAQPAGTASERQVVPPGEA